MTTKLAKLRENKGMAKKIQISRRRVRAIHTTL
jgi:hypothetical protein